MVRKKIERKDKQCYLEFVWLSASEHAHLEELVGKEELARWIQDLNGYIGAQGKDPYASHYYTIQNWARRSAAKKTTVVNDGSLVAWFGVLELLKNPTARMPSSPEVLRCALYNMLSTRKMNWYQFRELLSQRPDLEPDLRKEFVEQYHAKKENG